MCQTMTFQQLVKKITINYADKSVNFEIIVDASIFPESEHPYKNNTDKTWHYIHPTYADYLQITFSDDTITESEHDWIYIYDEHNNQIGQYSDYELSGQIVVVPGNSFFIRLVSDSYTTKNGFKVIDIEAICYHTFGDWQISKQPTCTSTGEKSRVCSLCGCKETESISILGHHYSTDWTIDIPATCTTVGSKSHHCTVCGEKTDITEIPISHTWEENYTVDIEPTETTEGSQSIHCTKCDAKTNVTVIPKLVEESPQEDFEYSIRSGKVTINGYKGTSLIVSIPTYIDGYPVTSISSFVFHNNTTITKVVIPYTVTDLGNYAFYNCSNLAEITLGSGLRTIAKSCFYNCKSLKTVVLPESITSIQDRAFYCCENLTDIELSNNIASIGELAFYRCSSLSSINFGKNISSVGNDAFYKTIWFNNLVGDCLIMGDGILMKFKNEFGEDVIIPEGVKSIYSDAIETSYVSTVYLPSTLTDFNNSALNIDAELFIVDSNNPYLCTIGGVIYSKDKTYLKAVPSKKTGTLVLPDTVLYIEASAFESSYLENVVLNNGLLEIGEKAFYFSKTKVNIPKTVTKIGSNAFCYNTVITEIVIPDGVETIESWTFSGCSSLKKNNFANRFK